MQLIQFLLPLYDQQQQAFPKSLFDTVREELTQEYGGVTAYVRSPAVGAWEDDSGSVQHDDMVLHEVLTDAFDREWWLRYRHTLEQRFAQEKILVRATQVDCL